MKARVALELHGIEVRHGSHGRYGLIGHRVLDIPAFRLAEGDRLAVTGAHGGGKSTLLYLLAGLVPPHAGELRWFARSLYRMSEPARDRWRATNVGMVFQEPNLFRELSALENVLLPNWLHNAKSETRLTLRARQLLERVGVGPDVRGLALSRGEAQRVALIRALVRHPPIVLADEPTASLDRINAATVRDLLIALAGEYGATLVVATDDMSFAGAMAHRLAFPGGSQLAASAPDTLAPAAVHRRSIGAGLRSG